MSTRAAIYVRQSQDVRIGIERQLKLTRKLAKDKGWVVVGEYVDNETSAARVRGANTAWARMVAERDSFDAVLAVDLDRLLRSIRDLVTLVDLGVIVATVSGDLDSTTAEGKFRATIMAGVAEFENGRRVERMRRAADQRVSTGLPVIIGRPYGWERDMITLIPFEAKIVEEATRRVICGVPMGAQVTKLNAEHIVTRNGGAWRISQLRNVLLRERNAGRLVRHGVVQEVSQIQPIVTPEEFDLCKSILLDPARFMPVRVRPALFWLSGLMVCSVCRRTMPEARYGAHRQYLCQQKYAQRRDGLSHVAIKASLAETAVGNAFAGWAADNGGLGAPPSPLERESLDRRLAAVATARSVATRALMQVGADRSMIEARLAHLAARADRLNRRRAWDITRTIEGVDWTALTTPTAQGNSKMSRAARLAVAETWWGKSSWNTKRKIVEAIFTIEVRKGIRGPERIVVTHR